MDTQIIEVALADRSYPIYIGQHLLTQTQLITAHQPEQQCLVVTNDTVAKLYLKTITTQLACDILILPDGEAFKTLTTLQKIFDTLLTQGHDRSTLLCALGGGVIGDLTGFAAACYRRGVAYLQMPTTLLAQVDAAIGGKTGCNHPLGKNMIGAIYQPQAVIIDLNTLSTLPDREYYAGLAEVIKYALLADSELFQYLEHEVSAIMLRDLTVLQKIIAQSCRIKATIVAADERETTGQRALLNLGHTFAHALETITQYQKWLHGEAVAIGLVMAADMSYRYGWLTPEAVSRIKKLIAAFKLPVTLPAGFSPEIILQAMRFDKKTLNKIMHLILLEKIGAAKVVKDFAAEDLQNCVFSFVNVHSSN